MGYCPKKNCDDKWILGYGDQILLLSQAVDEFTQTETTCIHMGHNCGILKQNIGLMACTIECQSPAHHGQLT